SVAHFRRRRTCTRMGDPTNPNFSRNWLTRYRSYEKWSVMATLVKNTKVGGATPICAEYMMRTCLRPGLTGGFAAVTASMNLLRTGVGTRLRRVAAILSIASRILGV